MDQKQQRELVSKLIEASNNIERLPKADHVFIHEQTIDNICNEYNVSRDEALIILEQMFKG